MAKTYEVKFKEFDKNEGQEMQVRTNDIEFTVEQICRNRNIEDITPMIIHFPGIKYFKSTSQHMI